MQLTKRIENTRISEKEYRSIKTALSYSAIKMFDTNRQRFFREIVLGEPSREKLSDSLLLGQLVHSMMAGEDFDIKFKIATVTKPSGQMGDLVDELYDRSLRSMMDGIQTDSFSVIFGEAFMKCKYDYTGNEIAFKGKDVDKVLQMFQDTGELYYREKLEAIGKMVVIVPMIENAEKVVEKLRNHPYTSYIATIQSDGEGIEVFSELPIQFEWEGVPYKILPDKLMVDHEHMRISPIDWKLSWESDEPSKVYVKYGYYIQAALYDKGIKEWAKEHELSNYVVDAMRFVFADPTNFMDPCILTLTLDDIDRAMRGFTVHGYKSPGLIELCSEIAHCVETGVWTSNKAQYNNQGVVPLDIKYGSR